MDFGVGLLSEKKGWGRRKERKREEGRAGIGGKDGTQIAAIG